MDVLALGDIGLDEYLDEPAPRPGGCALNVAFALRASGVARVAAAGPIGDDGAALADLLRARGVDVAGVERLPGATPRQRIAVRPDGERDFAGYLPGVLAGWRPGTAAAAAAREAELVYVPTFDATLDLAAWVWGERPAGAPLALDLMNMTDVDDAFVDEALRRASVVFAGLHAERDATRIERLTALSARDGAALVVVTLGPRGAQALSGGERVARPAAPVPGGRVVDTTGCGDAFAGAFLAARARGEGLAEALDAGARLGARVAATRGAVV
ncbi:MAG: carbohydrate kinase family protein [Planctomycetes bacterium]|nr:carbohydrate kinase family protein [Planctomycetota bacterium]